MILLLVCAGFIAATTAAVVAFVSGAGLVAAAVAYVLFGTAGVFAMAIVVSLVRVGRSIIARGDGNAPSYAVARVTVPETASHAPGTNARPSTRSGLVGGGMTTSESTSNPNRA